MWTQTTAGPLAPSPVSAGRAAWLLTRLHLRRQLNQIRLARAFGKASTGRIGTAGKSSGWLLPAFLAVLTLGGSAMMSHQGLANMRKVLGTVEVYKNPPRSWLGVQIAPVTAELSDRLGVSPPRGAFITTVADGGPPSLQGCNLETLSSSSTARTSGTRATCRASSPPPRSGRSPRW